MSRRKGSGLAVPVAIGLLLAGYHYAHGDASASSVLGSVTSAVTSGGSNVDLARQMAAQHGWTGGQWTCLDELWTRESGFVTNATYPSTTTPYSTPGSSISTAYGIPQALPAQKMAAAGSDWQRNPQTQIRWGLGYIAGRYGNPCAAWAYEVANNGY